jgi:hypothetical protein
MERFTKHLENAEVGVDCTKCKADWAKAHRGKDMGSCTALYCRNRLKNRLAAYEDTGLTPEEVHSMQGEWSAMMAALNSIGGGYTRLRELAEADKAGRVVVLPCKVGDELWSFCTYPTARVYGFTVTDISTLNGRTVLNTLGCGTLWGRDIGKTVFLTREEAKKALEAMKDE